MQYIEWLMQNRDFWPVMGLAGVALLVTGCLTGWLYRSRKAAQVQAAMGEQLFQLQKQLELEQAASQYHSQRLQEASQQRDAAQQALELERARGSRLVAEVARAGSQLQAQERAEKELRSQLAESKHRMAAHEQNYQDLQDRHQQLGNELTELRTTLAGREEHFQQQLQQLDDSRQVLAREFENLANRIFEEKGKAFAQTSQTGIDSLLKPFREQIEGFQKRVNEVHDAALQGNARLNAEIGEVLKTGLRMAQEASDLTRALKGDAQQRGAWGEAQLRRTLELGGLIEDAHYESQTALRDAGGRQRQTDYLIKLPDGKHIIIDSKVTLNAYERLINAGTDQERSSAEQEHIRAVRRHMDDLAAKDYASLPGMRSPGFVLMFMPLEPAYIEALKLDSGLFDYGYRKGVVLVSHTTLIPVLRTVSSLWMIERSSAEAREISERAGDIYNQVCTLAERLARLGATLGTASNHFNSTVTALAGQQGLYGKVERFSQLSARVSKSLPPLEPAHLDFESERLNLIVEPLPDTARASADRTLPV